MRKMMLLSLAALLLLCACQDPEAEVSPTPAPVQTEHQSPTVDPSDLVRSFTFTEVKVRTSGGSRRCALTEPQWERLLSRIDPDSWEPVLNLLTVDTSPTYVLYDAEGNSLAVGTRSGFSLIAVRQGQETYGFRASAQVRQDFDAYLGTLPSLWPVDPQAEQYYDLFQAEPGVAALIGRATEDGSFTDDQLVAYAAAQLAYEGRPRSASGEVISTHFGRTMDSDAVPAPSCDGGIHLVLDSVLETTQSGAVTAVFQCYSISEATAEDLDLSSDQIRQLLLSGLDECFSTPQIILLRFEVRTDPETQAPYVFYHSLKVLVDAQTSLFSYWDILQGRSEWRLMKERSGLALHQEKRMMDLDAYRDTLDTPDQSLSLAFCDLNRDNVTDVIVKSGEEYLILSEQNGSVYGFLYDIGDICDLKADGTFCYNRFDHPNITRLGSYGGKDGPALYTTTYTYYEDTVVCLEYTPAGYVVEGEPVSQSAYLAALEEQAEKPDVTWYEFTGENLGAIFAQWLG